MASPLSSMYVSRFCFHSRSKNYIKFLSGGKKQSEAGNCSAIRDFSFNFWYGNSGFSIKLLTDVCFTHKERELISALLF